MRVITLLGWFLGSEKTRCIYYPSKTLIDAQLNYATTEEFLAIIYAFDKFRSYLILTKVIVYMGHSATKL